MQKSGVIPHLTFDDNNEITFNKFDDSDWDYAIKNLDSMQTAWEQAVANASDKQLAEWSRTIANISTHTGQIV